MKRKRELSPDEFISHYPPPLRELADALRALVRATLPDAVETVNAGWGLLAYRVPDGKSTAYFGYIGADGDTHIWVSSTEFYCRTRRICCKARARRCAISRFGMCAKSGKKNLRI